MTTVVDPVPLSIRHHTVYRVTRSFIRVEHGAGKKVQECGHSGQATQTVIVTTSLKQSRLSGVRSFGEAPITPLIAQRRQRDTRGSEGTARVETVGFRAST
jgi:hypothetical protein